jgi:hypothetical protein
MALKWQHREIPKIAGDRERRRNDAAEIGRSRHKLPDRWQRTAGEACEPQGLRFPIWCGFK